jgi:RND family efflux transporter MFP subunit
MSRSRNRRLAVGLVVVVAGAAGTAGWLNRDDGSRKTATVATAAADTGEVTVSVAANGTIGASVTRSLAFGVNGTVTTVAVRAGSKVTAGAVLASVDATEAAAAVDDAQDSLDAARSQLSSAKTAVAAAATTNRHAAAGDAARVSGADSILGARQRVNQAVATLAAAKGALAGVTLTAPISGTVMSVAGKVGSQVSRGATFVTVADTNTMRVAADFPESDAGSLAVGQQATVTLADKVGAAYPATVVQVDPVGTSDGTLVTYGVLLALTKTPAGLLVGQTAGVEVRTGSVAKTLRVPSTAVHDDTVLVRTGTASEPRTVGVGLRGDQYTQITSGLTAGELVVRSW